LPNGSFENGLQRWQTGGHSNDEIAVVSVDNDQARHAVRIDTRNVHWGERSVLSDPVAVEAAATYEVRGLVKRLAGYGYRSSVAVVWKDARHRMIGAENVWCGVLYGSDWVQESRRVIAPAGAVSAQIKAGIEMGTGERNAALFTDLQFERVADTSPQLAIHLFAGKTLKGASSGLKIHLTNTGGRQLSRLAVSFVLPAGMTAETNRWNCDQLGAGEVWSREISLSGYPENSRDRIKVSVTGRAGDQKVVFEQSTPVHISDATPVVTPSEKLNLPPLPDMKVRLGAYYFPVMIDWGGGHRPGLRAIESMKPLLGYYDERSPEVADWHIAWARQHGISWLAVDWYWNQGEEVLNEALDEGLMKSRFFDQMDFCIHWCNQDPASTTFRAYDYSPATLKELADTLCDRYFSRKNYLKVEGKPVFMIFQPASLVNDNGGPAGTRAALDVMEEAARSKGFKGIYFVAVNNSPVVPDYAGAGFDAVSPYSFLFASLLPKRTDRIEFDYDRIVQRYVEYFKLNQQQVHAQGLKYIPTAWAGWDDLPRHGEHRRAQSVTTAGNTPEKFRAMVQALPDFAEKENPLALIEAWNEWGEGTVVEPGKQYGFDYLSAIWSVLGVNAPEKYAVPVPDDMSYQRMQAAPVFIDNLPYAERLNASRQWKNGVKMDFDSKRSLWLRVDGDEGYAWIADGMLHVLLHQAGVRLTGPEAFWLDASVVKGIALRLRSDADTRVALQWRTGPDAPWKGTPVQQVPAGRWTELRFDCAGAAGWTGEIYQIGLAFKDGPGRVELDWLNTLNGSER
jgi:hypothetical protein